MNIHQTDNYDQFKMVEGNRPINQRHVKNLMASLMKQNLLASNPVIVNERLEVIDGQHRLEAAKSLGLPVTYIVVDRWGLPQVQILNAHNRQWQPEDYLNSYIQRGYVEYEALKEFIDNYGFSISIALGLLGNFQARPGELLREFKEGNFRVVDLGMAEEFASKLSELEAYCAPWVYKDRDFINALAAFYKEHDHLQLMRALKRPGTRITRQLTRGDYFEDLKRIYQKGG